MYYLIDKNTHHQYIFKMCNKMTIIQISIAREFNMLHFLRGYC